MIPLVNRCSDQRRNDDSLGRSVYRLSDEDYPAPHKLAWKALDLQHRTGDGDK